MHKSALVLLLLFVLLGLVESEEWFMPDSNLINEQEFVQKVTNDNSCFKFVKFFTPHCPYCRYLKAVIDTLKHQKQWCFKIFDFNCQWYPQFCMKNVRSTSFPYTAIYNQKGQLTQEIHGFYPEPIISGIFQRIEQSCKNLKQSAQAVAPQPAPQSAANQSKQQPVAKQSSLATEPTPKKQDIQKKSPQQPAIKVAAQPEKQKKIEQSHQQTSAQNNNQQKPVQTSTSSPNSNGQQPPSKGSQIKSLPPYISYFFYGGCIVVAAYYVYSLHSRQSGLAESHHSDRDPNKEKKQQTESKESKGREQKNEDPNMADEEGQFLELADDQL